MSEMYKTCGSCRGKKMMIVLGGMKEDCPYCNGTGYIINDSFEESKLTLPQEEVVEKNASEIIEEHLEKEPIRKKRGRRKRILSHEEE